MDIYTGRGRLTSHDVLPTVSPTSTAQLILKNYPCFTENPWCHAPLKKLCRYSSGTAWNKETSGQHVFLWCFVCSFRVTHFPLPRYLKGKGRGGVISTIVMVQCKNTSQNQNKTRVLAEVRFVIFHWIVDSPSRFSSWWFQPIWQILVKLGIFPK